MGSCYVWCGKRIVGWQWQVAFYVYNFIIMVHMFVFWWTQNMNTHCLARISRPLIMEKYYL